MGAFSDTFSSVAAGRAKKAADAAETNLYASVAILQRIDEMRNWQTGRFNDMIDAFKKQTNILQQDNQELKNKINDLQDQVAGLQQRLYQEQEKNKGIAR